MSDPHSFLRPELLEPLRVRLQARALRRPSMILGAGSSPELVEAVQVVEEYGALIEAAYLMMAADRRVVNVEREVLRGALDFLSQGRVRTSQMEAMLDAAARKYAEEGAERRIEKVIATLRNDPERAELTVALAAAVAAADQAIVPEEQHLLRRLLDGLGISSERAEDLLKALDADLTSDET